MATCATAASVDGALFIDRLEVAIIHKAVDRSYGDLVGGGTGALSPEPGFTGAHRTSSSMCPMSNGASSDSGPNGTRMLADELNPADCP